MNPTWKIVFKGEILPDFNIETAKSNFAKLFKMPLEQVDPMFSGKEFTLKSEVTREQLTPILDSFKKRGLIVHAVSNETIIRSNNAQTINCPACGAQQSAGVSFCTQCASNIAYYVAQRNNDLIQKNKIKSAPLSLEPLSLETEEHNQNTVEDGADATFTNVNQNHHSYGGNQQQESQNFNQQYYANDASYMSEKNDVYMYSDEYDEIPSFFEFNIDGRIGRLSYINGGLILNLIGFGVMLFLFIFFGGSIAMLSRTPSISSAIGIGGGMIFAFLVIFVPWVYWSVRLSILRLHDLGWSGWWVLLFGLGSLIPIVSVLVGIAGFVIYYCLPGTKGANRYGSPVPAGSIIGLVISVIIFVLAFSFGILGGILSAATR
ncbi:DUF805 domain-containing protein [Neisseria sp. Ec49-e6-T10]|uniref:DUF805 domain-containing protein n=1 Tax=Neisseria sp. Ec49-e6-T10 TaxID=3140744 RepID=UPI003EB838A7